MSQNHTKNRCLKKQKEMLNTNQNYKCHIQPLPPIPRQSDTFQMNKRRTKSGLSVNQTFQQHTVCNLKRQTL